MSQHHDSPDAEQTPDTAQIKADHHGRDLDEAFALYAGNYNGSGFYAEQTELPFAYRYTIDGDDDVTLRSSRFLGSIRGTVQPEGEYIVSWLTAGQGLMDIGADELRMVRGRPAMFPTGRRYAFHLSDFRQNLIHFDSGYLERIAAERAGAEPSRLHFDHTAIPDTAALVAWNEAVQVAARAILGTPSTELQQSEAKRLLAGALLDTFAHEGPERRGLAVAPGNARLVAALEFVHEHAAEPITTTAIADAAGLSLRGLQHAFHQQFESTPSEYLRGVRLDRVRGELLAAAPSETTVSMIALRWGFAHSGRFSSAYVKRFGEYPAQTLRR